MKTVIFKGQILTRTKVKNNILKMFNKTSKAQRFDWYLDAFKFAEELSKKNNVPLSVASGVIAALSPVKQWEQNKICAQSMLETGEGKHMKQFTNKAKLIINSDGTEKEVLRILNGRKISAFFQNILYPNLNQNLTIDRHALSIALGVWVHDTTYSGLTATQYNFFVQCYTLAAEQANVSGLIMQSSTWLRFREIKSEYKRL